ncbi:unnamed protein product [Amoebophrya sp. A120]|nr:unnamed protein product [Amoebophrya sp. A120]|eukprot:GSA120T00007459001.1
MVDSQDRVLLKVSVELAEGVTELLYVKQADLNAKDGIRKLAEEFCRAQNLDLTRVRAPLEAHIRENVAAAQLEEKQQRASSSSGGAGNRRSVENSMQYQPLAGGLERILDRISVGETKRATSSTNPSFLDQPPKSARRSTTGNYNTNQYVDSDPDPGGGGDSTNNVATSASSRQKMQQQILQKLKSGRSRSHVFRRLHQDGAERALRIDIQRKNEQRAREDRAKSPRERKKKMNGEFAGGTGGGATTSSNLFHSVVRQSDRSIHPLEKLYRDAQDKRARLERRAQQKEELLNLELAQYPFKPQIHASQKTVAGLESGGKVSLKTREKIEQLRQQKMLKELQDCTFKPEIDERSALMMKRRIERLKITGSLHDHLYEDAKRREERMYEYANLVSPEVTFKPDIGTHKDRPPPDANVADFFDRMMKQKSSGQLQTREYAHQKLGIKIKQDPMENCSFQPQVGRPPHFPRNEDKKPIGHFLYEVGQYVRNLKEEIVEAKLQEEERKRVPVMSEVSKLVYEEKKKKKFKEIFEKLSDGNSEISQEVFHLDQIPLEFHEFLRPILAYLEETNGKFDFHGFSITMDYVLEKTGVPCSHLFSAVEKREKEELLGNTAAYGSVMSQKATPRGPYDPTAAHTYTPRINPNSTKILEEKGRLQSNVPVHERLWSTHEKYQQRTELRRQQLAEQEMLECTFTPNRLNQGAKQTPRGGPVAVAGAAKNTTIPASTTKFAPASRTAAPKGATARRLSDNAEVDAALEGAETAVKNATAAVERVKKTSS